MSTALFHRFENVVVPVTDLQHEPLAALEWEVIDSDLWVRPADSDVRIVWKYLVPQDNTNKLLSDAQLQKRAAKRLGKALTVGRFWRYWPLAEQQIGLLLRRNFGLIQLSDKPVTSRFFFAEEFQNTNEALLAEPEQIENLVARLEQEADFSEALRWLRDYQNDWLNVVFERGSRSELEVLLNGFWALFCSQHSEFDSWRFWSHGNTEKEHIWRCPWIPEFSTDAIAKARNERLFALLNEHIVMKSASTRRYSLEGEQQPVWGLPIYVSRPSQHERIEGLLAWRAFLRDKIAPEEVESLLKV